MLASVPPYEPIINYIWLVPFVSKVTKTFRETFVKRYETPRKKARGKSSFSTFRDIELEGESKFSFWWYLFLFRRSVSSSHFDCCFECKWNDGRTSNVVGTRAERRLSPGRFWVLPYVHECVYNMIETLHGKMFSVSLGKRSGSWRGRSSSEPINLIVLV